MSEIVLKCILRALNPHDASEASELGYYSACPKGALEALQAAEAMEIQLTSDHGSDYKPEVWLELGHKRMWADDIHRENRSLNTSPSAPPDEFGQRLLDTYFKA